MELSQSLNFGDEFMEPNFHGNESLSTTRFVPYRGEESRASSTLLRNDSRNQTARVAVDDRPSCPALGQKTKRNKLVSALKEKIISDNISARNSIRTLHSENDELSSASSRTISEFDELEDDDEKTYRNEIYNNDCFIDSLKEKYVCLNFEFNELQERHGKFVRNQNKTKNNYDQEEGTYSDSSDNPLERKFTQIFHSNPTPNNCVPKNKNPPKRHNAQMKQEKKMEDKENIPLCQHSNRELKLILKTLKKIFKCPPTAARDTPELKKLYEVVKSLQEEQEKFRSIIKEQQDQLNDFQSRYIKAQDIIQSQKYEIKQLCLTNTQLENELNKNMNELKETFQQKISEVSHLPRAVKAEKTKCDKLTKDNIILISRLQQMKQELITARSKLEEASQRRSKILGKLKSAERDLKIFRTQNNTLKVEKRSLYEELRKLRGENDDLKSTSSKNISRQKERGETQQRLLRKKIIDLEMELDRSRNSTTVLIEERDKLITELHMQLNTLVHNFETSQKHIRILRRHIYSLSNSQRAPEKNS